MKLYQGGDDYPLAIRTLGGLEAVLADELRALGARDITTARRLVSCSGDKHFLYRVNYTVRTAIRILIPIASATVRNEAELRRAVQQIDWTTWLTLDTTLAVDSLLYNSNLTHSLYSSQLIKDAIVDQFRDRFGRRPSVDLANPDVQISLFLNRNQATIYVDSSGDSLHKRGYRTETHAAPLNEVLAAGILHLTGWDKRAPLVDGMCGTGTLLIEAGLMARQMAPGKFRRWFGFMGWPDFDKPLFDRVRAEATAAELPTLPGEICGTEVNKKTVAIAKRNVEHAELAGYIDIKKRAFEDTPPPAAEPGATLVMNPPYGERMEVPEIEAKYKLIGDTLKQLFAGYTGWIFTGNLTAAKRIGLRPARRIELMNGKIDCRLLKYELYTGSRRPDKTTRD